MWASSFPYEFLYPVLNAKRFDIAFSTPHFGGMSSAPNSYTYYLESAGKGFLDRLPTQNGAYLVAPTRSFDLLGTYCLENDIGTLSVDPIYQSSLFNISKVRCLR